ncbi:YdaU family protein [Psychrobacter sp. T6-6]|uniref:YdaU family protein n=1 Tax=Psychrobacter sp. T6-6 TaxID=3457452 RepID=UPI003FCEF512
MHYIAHNFSDWDSSTLHMTRTERSIYFDLRSLYLLQEQPIDGGDMALLQRRVRATNDEEKAALTFVLKDKFKKAGKLYKCSEWDKIISSYHYKAISGATKEMIKRLSDAGETVAANAGVTNIRVAYIEKFGHDEHTRITNRANAKANEGERHHERTNAKANAITNDDEHQDERESEQLSARERSKRERKYMVEKLKTAGESVTLKTAIATLRALYGKHFNGDALTDMQEDERTNAKANANINNDERMGEQQSERANEITNRANEQNSSHNQEPETTNHKPSTNNQVSEGKHTSPVTVSDSFEDSFELTQQTEEDMRLAEQKRLNAQVPVQAEQIRSQHSGDIENWQAPSYKEMQDMLLMAGKQMSFTGTEYTIHIDDFKAHHAEQAIKGKPLVTESNRKAKLRKWLMDEINKQSITQARQEKAKGRFTTDNEDWTGTTAKNASDFDSDLPPIYHPSHETAKANDDMPLFLNGCKRMPLPGMTNLETEAYVDRYVQPGEARVTAYDRLLEDMKEAV